MVSRRNFFKSSALAMASGALLPSEKAEAKARLDAKTPLKLGLVTYNLAKEWDIDTLIKNCTETKFDAVELRTTHAHGVEPGLTAEQRREVRKKFADSPVKLASLGSVCEFDSPDPQVLQQNIETCRMFVQLAADVRAEGVKVRPNRLHLDKGIPEETTLKQIGESLALVGSFAKEYGVEIRVEVHGSDTSRVPPVSDERSPPDSRITAADSPVMALSSTEAMPSITSPSVGTMSPASTRIRLPGSSNSTSCNS